MASPIPLNRWFACAAACFTLLFWAGPAMAQLEISELMASNKSVLQDEDGDYSDWIEIFNSGTNAVDLAGWHLTDKANNLTQWTFPSTNLPAGGYLIVFASSKDRTGAVLHANFSLSASGEFLALVQPDGTTIEAGYDPFPEQFEDVSYGIQTEGSNPTLRKHEPGYLIYHTPGAANTVWPAAHPAYSDYSVAQLDLIVPQSTWDALMNDPWSEVRRPADVRFRHGDIDVLLTNIGIRCRGATSRDKQPRSFNIAFDANDDDSKLFGLERFNLNSDANDPTMARPKLSHDIQNAMGLAVSRGNYVAVVVSNTTTHEVFFDAVRNNSESIDDVFLESRFINKRGNLYKCNHREWEATLEKRGSGQGSDYIGDGSTYELDYSGAGDNSYSDFAAFVSLINDTPSNDFPSAIMNAFEVDDFLKRMAIDVLTGNWDDYWSNGNNYHLFLSPITRRWIYIPYDFDNTFGISWDSGAVNWANRDIDNWKSYAYPTPLADRIFAVPEFKNRFKFYMKQVLDTVFTMDLTNSIYHYRATMTAPLPFPDWVSSTNMKASEKQRYAGWGTWNWTYDQFWYSYDYPQWNMNPNLPANYRDMSFTNFIHTRRTSALSQLGTLTNIAPILSAFSLQPAQPQPTDALAFSIRAMDDVAVSNVTLYYSFNGSPTTAVEMAQQADGAYTATLSAFAVEGLLRYHIRATDNTGKVTFHPYGGAQYAAELEIADPPRQIVVTEVNYHAYDPTPAETNLGFSTADDFDFIELFNAGTNAVNLTGWKITDGIGGTLTSNVLAAGEYAVVVKSTNAFRARYTNANIRILGTFTGNLKNSSETFNLEDTGGKIIASVTYADSGNWPRRPDGDGSSLELLDVEADYNDPFSWRASSLYGGSPGSAGLGPDDRIVINEILTHTDPPLSDAIELFNTTTNAIDIGGWYLSDSKSNYQKFRIPDNTILAAGGYIVFNETNHFNVSGGTNANDFALDAAHGEKLFLWEGNAFSNLVRFADEVQFGAAANGESFGRWPNGSGALYPMNSRTFGAFNSGPRVGPAFVSEVMYNPLSGEADLEFIEIANPGPTSIDLTRWKVEGDATFSFTNGTLLSGDTLVVLSFDPAASSNAARLAAFESAYSITSSPAYFGPYVGTLSDTGGVIRLMRPDDPPAEEPSYYPMLLEDEVRYGVAAPWPTTPNGGGASLERNIPVEWGNDPASWSGNATPTPGAPLPPQPIHYTLNIESAHGTAVPPVGSSQHFEGTVVTATVSAVETQGDTRFVNTGWILSGNEPANGSTNEVVIAITNDATLSWQWATNYMLTASAAPGGAIELSTNGWLLAGTSVELTAIPSNSFAFTEWSGDTNAISSGSATSPVISVQMNGPVSLTANFNSVVPTYFASPSGSHTPPYTSWATAATSLHALVSIMPAGSTGLVAAATYTLPSTLLITNAIHLKSAAGPTATILDGANSARVMEIKDPGAIVDGFTLQNGNSGASSGGGLRIDGGGLLVNSIVRNNTTTKSGGGATLLGSGEIRNSLFYGNTANSERGGAIYTYAGDSDPIAGAPVIDSCTFANNSSANGGGVYLFNAATLINSILWNNTASSGSNLFVTGTAQVVSFTLVGPLPAGAGNLGADPLFVGAGDYRLTPASPAINAGTNRSWMSTAQDLAGRPRALYGANDIGAFEALLPGEDSDNDGMGDWQEDQAGTDPFDTNSFLGIEAADVSPSEAGHFLMRWNSASGRVYRITYTTNALHAFDSIVTQGINATPPVNVYTGSLESADALRAYRIELE